MRHTVTKYDLLAAFVLFVLPLLLFAPVTLGSKTLLPVENRFTFEPYRSQAGAVGAGAPQNELLSDLILENYVWKGFIRQAIANRELPLWNPYIFSGQPFLANGQHSAMYPPSLLFYLLPLPKAYGWFTVFQLWLAGLFSYIFLRTLQANRAGALLGGLTFSLSGFFVYSVVFTMIIAAAAWLPLILAVIEIVIRKQAAKGTRSYSPIPYLVLGAAAVGMQVLAGHIEITLYMLLVSAFYALCRLIFLWRDQGTPRPALRLAGWLLTMMVIGLGLGAVQFIPFYEIGRANFREGAASLAEVRGWALPYRRLISFFIPNFFGSPAHHGFFDLVSRRWQPLGLNAHGQINPLCPNCTGWDTKNAVEAAAYTGILALTFSSYIILAALKRLNLGQEARRQVFIFAALTLASLLFIFGTPFYALLFYGVPFVNQLHTPFRWIYPFTLSIAVLAGLGLTHLTANRLSRTMAWLLLGGGLTGGLGALVVFIAPTPFIRLSQFGFDRSGLAQNAFADGRQFLSYLWPQLLAFFSFLFLSGLVLWLVQRRSLGLWRSLAIAVLALDLIVAGWGFNPAADPALLTFTPPAIAWLQAQQAADPLFRITSYEGPDHKIFAANTPMSEGIFDVRGYDSVIAKQYLDFMQLIQGNEDWLNNRIGPLYQAWAGALDSALLDLLGVRYVLSIEPITNPNYRLAYEGEIKIYENIDALPRAFIVPEAESEIEDLSFALRSLNPRQKVLLDGAQINPGHDLTSAEAGLAADSTGVAITRYDNNEVLLSGQLAQPGWLVLADTYFPGWKAYATPVEPGQATAEQEITIHRADGNFRAVFLPPGEWAIRFVYTPMSFKLGAYTSFVAGVILCLLVAYWLWGRLYQESERDSTVKRVAKNSLAPMILALLNRVIDFAFALLMLRILAPAGVGQYTFAVSLITFFEILTRFGLGTFLTREVARDHADGNKYLLNVTLLRNLLWLLAIPIFGGVLAFYRLTNSITITEIITVALFAVGIFFSNIADGLSGLFYAYEKAEYPAFISTVTTQIKVTLGALALLLGFGIIGLAGVSVVVNVSTVLILGTIMLRKIFRPAFESDGRLQRTMLAEGFPLMLNHLLATVFFRIDVLILKPTWGDKAVGYYNAAYKYVDGINVIPQYFTLAIFPLMSRYASTSRESLSRAYILSLRLLQMVAIPLAVGTPFIAKDLILILGGAEFIPDSVIALQLLIWFLPFSFINQVTQYVLIAINQQRFLTWAFLIGVTFNIGANLILIPQYGYRAAAITTVFSEWALLLPFYYAVRKNLCLVPWFDVVWRPALAALGMGGVLWLIQGWTVLLQVPLAGLVYLILLGLVGGYRQPDMALIWQAAPFQRLRARFVPG